MTDADLIIERHRAKRGLGVDPVGTLQQAQDEEDPGYNLTADDDGAPLFSDRDLRAIGSEAATNELLRRKALEKK